MEKLKEHQGRRYQMEIDRQERLDADELSTMRYLFDRAHLEADRA